MKSIKKVIDINAHVDDIDCQVTAGAGSSIATIGFKNLGYGTVTAIKFNAKGYNSFGDVVLINGKEQFFLIIQDISIEKNTEVKELKANLPNADIRKLELVESQICFADGTVASYDGEDSREFELEEYDEYGAERDIADALKDKFGSEFKLKPVEYAEGWICGCGRFNRAEINSCTKCRTMKADAFKFTSESESAKLISSYKEAEEKRAEASREAAKQKEKEEKKKKIYIGIGAIVAIILAYFIIHASIMAGRRTYSSEDEMRKAVAGTYTHYSDYSGKADRQIVIKGDSVTIVWSHGSDMDSDVREWNFKNGTFKTFETYIVLSNGDIKDDDGDVYEKGGYMSSSSLGTSSYSYESGSTVLKIQDVEVTSNSSYTICTGSVKNTGTKTHKFVEVKGSFKDSSGNVVDTDWTYAAGSEGLAPGESSTFRLSVDKNYDIKSCSVTLLDYD